MLGSVQMAAPCWSVSPRAELRRQVILAKTKEEIAAKDRYCWCGWSFTARGKDGHSTGNMQHFIYHMKRLQILYKIKVYNGWSHASPRDKSFIKEWMKYIHILFFPETAETPRDLRGLLVRPKAARCCQRPGCLPGAHARGQGRAGGNWRVQSSPGRLSFCCHRFCVYVFFVRLLFETHLCFPPRDFIMGKLEGFFLLLTISLTWSALQLCSALALI